MDVRRRQAQTVSRETEALTFRQPVRLYSSVGIDPVHRTRFAVLGRAAELEETQAPQAATEPDLRAADDFSAAEAEPALMRAVPDTETVEALQQLELLFGRNVVFVHGRKVADSRFEPNRAAGGLDARLFS